MLRLPNERLTPLPYYKVDYHKRPVPIRPKTCWASAVRLAHLGECSVKGVHGTAEVVCEQHSPPSQFLYLPQGRCLRLMTHVQAVVCGCEVEVSGQ